MNRILLEPEEISPDNTATLGGERAAHIINVLKLDVGEHLRTGTLNGNAGESTILNIDRSRTEVTLKASHLLSPLRPWCDLILAMPRPKVMKRLWAQLAALGVGRIVLLNAAKVEKYYFDSHVAEENFYRPLLIEGLQQSGATLLPEVSIRRFFKRFVEDEIDSLFSPEYRFLAHPSTASSTSMPDGAPSPAARPVLAIGPEGGWTDYELDMLSAAAFKPFSMGGRILRTDTACIAALSRLAITFDR